MSTNEYTQIGWIGLGQMGNPMVTRLLNAGIEVGVYNRSPDKTADLADKGAKVYASTVELIRAFPVIFLMVSDFAAVRDILSEEVRKELAGKIIVNMSTIAPSENLAVKELVEAAGGQFAEAPVSGSVGPATNGTLLVLFGGEDSVLTVEISSVVYSISRRILKHEHAQKHPPHPAPPTSHLAGLHTGEGKRHLPGTPLPSQPRHHLPRP